MSNVDPENMGDLQLPEHFISLHAAYNTACGQYDLTSARSIHEQMLKVKRVIDVRRGEGRQPSKLEKLSVSELIQRFMDLVIQHDAADDMPESEELYWRLDAVRGELQFREGDQRRALFSLYSHPDIRIRYAAAEATRSFSPILSANRMMEIEDVDWLPPSDGADINRAGLDEHFPKPWRSPSWPSPLQEMDVSQLTDRFLALALSQDQALQGDRIPEHNRLYCPLEAVVDELESREGDQRRALIQFHQHRNAQVRLKSAFATLSIAPEASRRTLQIISDRSDYPQAADARGVLWKKDMS